MFAVFISYVTTSLLHYVIKSLRHYVTTSLRHYVTTPLRHYATTSLRHYVIKLLSHYVTMSLRHYVTTSLRHYFTTSLRVFYSGHQSMEKFIPLLPNLNPKWLLLTDITHVPTANWNQMCTAVNKYRTTPLEIRSVFCSLCSLVQRTRNFTHFLW
jgi:hypothetical protein